MNTSTKASTLNTLKPKLKQAKILDLIVFTVKKWHENKESCLRNIKFTLANTEEYIVRSSSKLEDQLKASNAGKFTSVLNVTYEALSKAINKVITSYEASLYSNDEILVQPMLQHVTMSGVLFTKDPTTGGPYYIINYDVTGDTAAVTSGRYSGNTRIIARSCNNISGVKYQKLVKLAEELEKILVNSNLDIEFAFDKNGDLYLLQVRPLIIKQTCCTINQTHILENIKQKFINLSHQHPYLYGKRTIVGVMPDWNPAEIIGIRPRPLALSLYKELVTDNIWAYQRDNYGYKNLRSFPLLIDFGGIPYIDVRVSFNSFIPKELDKNIAGKLVNYYLDCLEKEPYLHDKVEFKIVFSCFTFDLINRSGILKEYGFSQTEIDAIIISLKKLTDQIIHPNKGLWVTDAQKVEELKKRHDLILFNDSFDDLTKIYWLIENCKRYGSLPFAGLARAGFIAIQFLDSMLAANILTPEERFLFLNSLDSISTKMIQDLHSLDREHFLQVYGHLRPGTYDILSLRYDEAPDLYFDWDKIKSCSYYKKEGFKLSCAQMKKIETLLDEHNLEHDVIELLDFMKSAIEGREYSKFIFTKTLSEVLSLIKKIAIKNDISIEDMSYINIQDILRLQTSAWNIVEAIDNSIMSGKQKYNITSQIILPSLIIRSEDVDNFDLLVTQPNFVTRKSVTGPVVTNISNTDKLDGAIVMIPSADPGYDWIFTHNIAGFVTTYGGVNSHMAIRANELSLPAIIGAGEKLYCKLSSANNIHIDCVNQIVEVIY